MVESVTPFDRQEAPAFSRKSSRLPPDTIINHTRLVRRFLSEMNPLPAWDTWAIVKAVGATVLGAFLGLNPAIVALAGLMALDLATGVLVGMSDKQLNSRRGTRGVTKKAGMVAIILGINIATYHLKSDRGPLPLDLGNWVTWFYVVTELISLVENCGKLGAPVPRRLKEALRKAQELADTEEVIEGVRQNQAVAVGALTEAQKGADKLSAAAVERAKEPV